MVVQSLVGGGGRGRGEGWFLGKLMTAGANSLLTFFRLHCGPSDLFYSFLEGLRT